MRFSLATIILSLFLFACTPQEVPDPNTIPAPWGAQDYCTRNPGADRCPG